MSDQKRLVWNEIAPQGAKALYGIHHYITSGTNLPSELVHLIFLRVSQINGCAHCIDLHTRDLLKTMPLEKVVLLPSLRSAVMNCAFFSPKHSTNFWSRFWASVIDRGVCAIGGIL